MSQLPGQPSTTGDVFSPGRLRRHLADGSAASFAIKIGGFGLTLASSVLLGRWLGEKGFGVYSIVAAWEMVFVLIGCVGLHQLITREMAAGSSQGAWGRVRGLLRWSDRVATAVSLATVAAAALAAWWLIDPADGALRQAFWIALPAVPLTVWMLLNQAAVRGLHRPIGGQVSEVMLRPGLLTVLVGAAVVTGRAAPSPQAAMVLHVLASAATWLVGWLLLVRCLPAEAKRAEPTVDGRAWLLSALPLLLAGGMRLINIRTDIIMLGILADTAEAGIYNAATRGSQFVLFILLSVNAVLAPAIAHLHADGQHRRLQRVLTLATRATLGLSIPVAAAMILLREPFLAMFGPGFTAGATPLAILCAGRCALTGVAFAGLVLVMTGHEWDAAIGTAAGAAANILGNAILIPPYGATGAAIATAVSSVAMNAALGCLVWRRLKLDTTFLGLGGGRR
ncbi:MAG: oligosaccharide flippase family protein [Planctomycetes bacterium]|nr:oligosaccharide flippase family protein [Planctomycetota bacterium]